tara:strand:+ start:153 stop:428 length:276 start_codon:yes stop_codon:yes gene_type:complete
MKITERQLRRIIREALEDLTHADKLGVTEPRYAVNRTTIEKLLSALMQRAAVEGASAEEAAAKLGLGNDQGVIAYIQNLLDNQLLDRPAGI